MGLIQIIVHVAVSAFLLTVVARLVTGIEVRDGGVALKTAVVLGLINYFVRPLIVALTFPLTLVTLGLFLVVINAIMLMLAAAFVDGFEIKGFKAAFIGSIVLSLMHLLIGILF